MLSSRRLAQLGLGAASLVLLSSMAVLLSGASDAPIAAATALSVGSIDQGGGPPVPPDSGKPVTSPDAPPKR
jgi:hypothetical protein